jgi:hypothetical protein
MNGLKLPTTGSRRSASVISTGLALCFAATVPHVAVAQTEFYNLDSNRPLRVEDALPTPRRSLDIQLAPLRLDELSGGTRRWRSDPKLSYGIAPQTELEVRAPVLLVQPRGGQAALGLTSLGVGVLHAFNTETAFLPALALSGEVLIPIGMLAPPNGSYAIKALLTKTLSVARVSVNASYGTYSVAPAAATSAQCRLAPPGAPGCNGQPSVPDVPCSRVPVATSMLGDAARMFSESAAGAPLYSTACLTSSAAAPSSPPSLGERWFAGAAIDHTFALASTLVAADVFAERFVGLSALVDWTAERGLRRQWSPRLVLDPGVARHFAGAFPSTAVTLGATLAVAIDRHGA